MLRKQFWVIAGGNGAGKSLFYRTRIKPSGLPFINADEIGLAEFTVKGKTDVTKASREAQRRVSEKLDHGDSFCYETVFSHPSKIDLVAKAKTLGYEVNIVFIHLISAELNEARVHQRVTQEKGHDVPRAKIYKRIPLVLENIAEALKLADNASLLDNSGGPDNPYVPIAIKEHGIWTSLKNPMPDWAIHLV